MHKRNLFAALAAAAALFCLAAPATALVPNTSLSVSYTGNGSSTTFATTYAFLKTTDLKVTVAGVTKTQGTDYNVIGAGGTTGSVIFISAPANGAAVVISRLVDYLQGTSLRSQTNYNAQAVEEALDKLAMGEQQLNAGIAQTTVLGPGALSADPPLLGDGSTGNHLRFDETAQFVWGGQHNFDNDVVLQQSTSGDPSLTVIGINDTNGDQNPLVIIEAGSGDAAGDSPGPALSISGGGNSRGGTGSPAIVATGGNLTDAIMATGDSGASGIRANGGGNGPGAILQGGAGTGQAFVATAGSPSGNGVAGAIGGTVAGTSGTANLSAGGTGGAGGPALIVTSGNGGSGTTTGAGGASGNAMTANGGVGGNGGATGNGGNGGKAYAGSGGSGGNGGSTSGTPGAGGSAIFVNSGIGGAAGTATGTGGSGGSNTILGGQGGSASGAGTGGAGGTGLNVNGGQGGVTTGGTSGAGGTGVIISAGIVNSQGNPAGGDGAHIGGTGGAGSGTNGDGMDVSAAGGGSGTTKGIVLALTQGNAIREHLNMNCLTSDPSAPVNGGWWVSGATCAQAKIRMNGASNSVLTTGTTNTSIQRLRASGCATSASANTTCTTTITWPTSFVDSSYSAVCMGDLITSGVPVLQGGVSSKSATAITVQTVNLTAVAAQFTTIDCIAVHD